MVVFRIVRDFTGSCDEYKFTLKKISMFFSFDFIKM